MGERRMDGKRGGDVLVGKDGRGEEGEVAHFGVVGLGQQQLNAGIGPCSGVSCLWRGGGGWGGFVEGLGGFVESLWGVCGGF